MWSWVHLSCIGVVAQPLRLAEMLFYSGSCVVPLRLGGLRGKKSTPSVGWEVPVSILGSARKVGMARDVARIVGLRTRCGHQSRQAKEAKVWLLIR